MMGLQEELSIPQLTTATAVTIGVFDGVHLGHQHLLRSVARAAKERGLSPAVVTFRNHPRSVLRPDDPVRWLTSLEDRVALLQAAGIEHVVPMTFTRDFSLLTAEEFTLTLRDSLRMAHMVVGPNFAMGYQRQGTFLVLQELGHKHGFTVEQATPLESGGARINSTGVREALGVGNVERVTSYLGRYFHVAGEVEHGEGRGGSELGFPTVNLHLEESQALPADGVYAAQAIVDGIPFTAAASVGTKPTFHTDGRLTVEAYLLDYTGDLYDRQVRLEFIKRLRPQEQFGTPEALAAQMRRDVEEVTEVMRSLTPIDNTMPSQSG